MLIAILIILQILIFIGLVFVFRKILKQNVILATQHLEELSKEYEQKEKKINQELEEARLKAEEMLNKAKEEAEKIKLEIIQSAENERDKIIQQARGQSDEIIKQADKAREKLLLELEERIAKAAIEKACLLIEETLPDEFKKIVHTHWVEDLIENGFSQVKQLRLPDELNEAKVISAFSLTDEEREKLKHKIKAVLGRNLVLKEAVDKNIVAGIIITLGDLVLDGSLKNKIKERARTG